MVNKSKTIDTEAADCVYYHTRAGGGVIGFDGCGAIDFDGSALVRELIESGPRIAERYRATLSPDIAERGIAMRRGVREFDFFYDYKFDTLIVSPAILTAFSAWIEPSSQGMTPVELHFGSRSRPYFFGNLKHSNALRSCCWERSIFATVDDARYDINQTKIERREVPLDHEVDYAARGQIFTDMADYYEKKPPLQMHVAERLGFNFSHVDIVNLGVGDTLISARLFEALWSLARPKARVLGMTGSRPLVAVDFE